MGDKPMSPSVSGYDQNSPVIRGFCKAMEAHGLIPPNDLVGDGRIHRCATMDKKKSKNGWYILLLDGAIPAGAFGNWRDDSQGTWSHKLERSYSLAEQAELKAKFEAAKKHREEERVRAAALAKAEAQRLWDPGVIPPSNHPYLKRKRIKPHGVRALATEYAGNPAGSLMIPLIDADSDEIQTLQFIRPDGDKRFIVDGPIKGRFHPLWAEIDAAADNPIKELAICEGFATAATALQKGGISAIMAIDSGNLPLVAAKMREKNLETKITIVADDDHRLAGNPGLTAALIAASMVDGYIAVPQFDGNRRDGDTDLNDLDSDYYGNPEAAANCLRAAIKPEDFIVNLEDPSKAIDLAKYLAKLKEDHPSVFTRIRGALKTQFASKGYKIKELDDAVEGEKEEKPKLVSSEVNGKTATVLIDIIKNQTKLFHDGDTTAYADIIVDGHRETYLVNRLGFKRWLKRRFLEITDNIPNSEAMNVAIGMADALAQSPSPLLPVWLRTAELNGKYYLDLCDPLWRAIEIDADGWRIINEPPVRFRRTNGMLSLPVPIAGGSIESLRSHVNVKTDEDFVLLVSWLAAALRPCGPYPVLALAGSPGASKSTLMRICRRLIDPSTTPIRALPKDDKDVFISANNAHVICYDNLSSLSDWLSDTICRLSSGGGFSSRALWTDDEERLFDVMRPVVLTAISDIIRKADLNERTLHIALETIEDNERKSERQLWEAFDKDCPTIFGALLDIVSHGLKFLPNTTLERLPRMADFAMWSIACEGRSFQAGDFQKAYRINTNQAGAIVLEGNDVADAVRSLMEIQSEWTGTATELLRRLDERAGEKVTRRKSWPKAANLLSGTLRQIARDLRDALNIEVVFRWEDRTKTTKLITIRKLPEADKEERPSSASSATNENSNLAADDVFDEPSAPSSAVPDVNGADDAPDDGKILSSADNPLKTKAADDADDGLPPTVPTGGDKHTCEPPVADTVASVPFMTTKHQKQALAKAGHTVEAIANMTPAEAHRIVGDLPAEAGLTHNEERYMLEEFGWDRAKLRATPTHVALDLIKNSGGRAHRDPLTIN
jgi:phage/plasmid primase-like uncharacterized protein